MFIQNKKEFFDLLDEWDASRQATTKKDVKEPEEVYLSQRETAKFLRVSLPTLISWKKTRKIPFYQKGKKVLFKKSEVLEAMKNSSL